MKSILYVGATLMIGASIYGFVDYKQTSRNKEFTNMYDEEKKEESTIVITKKVTESVEKKEGIKEVKKVAIKKQAVSNEAPIVSIKPIAENERINTNEIKEIDQSATDIKIAEESGIEKTVTKKRKFSTKLFSRGALDERYIEPKVKSKTESKKIEIKE